MNSESKPSSSTSRANALIPRARSPPSPSQTYEGRKTPKRSIGPVITSSLRAASSAVVPGWAFLDKAARALEKVVGGKDPERGLDLGGVARGERPIARPVDERLDRADGERPTLGNLGADRRRPSHGHPGRHDLGDQPDALGLGRVD